MRYSAKKGNWDLSFKIPMKGLKNVQAQKPSRGLVLERIVLERDRDILSSEQKIPIIISSIVVLLILLSIPLFLGITLEDMGTWWRLRTTTVTAQQDVLVPTPAIQPNPSEANEIYYQAQLQQLFSKSATNQHLTAEEMQQARLYLSEWYKLMLKRQQQENDPQLVTTPQYLVKLQEIVPESVATPLNPTVTALATPLPMRPLVGNESPFVKPLKKEVITLLQECKRLLQEKSLTSGKNGNAWVCYHDVLIQDPNNAEAHTGLQTIEKYYLEWIEKALKANNLQKAQSYVQNLQKISPNSPELSVLQQRLATREILVQKTSTEKPLTQNQGRDPRNSPAENKKPTLPSNETAKQQVTEVKDTSVPAQKPSPRKLPANKQLAHNRDSVAKNSTGTVKESLPPNNETVPAKQQVTELKSAVAPVQKSPPQKLPTEPPRASKKSVPSDSEKAPAKQQATEVKETVVPVQKKLTKEQSWQCSEIFSQESLGIVSLTVEQKEFQRLHCK